MFEDFEETPLKGKRYYVCQSGMQLWLALNLGAISIRDQRETTREEYKEAVLNFPESTNNCRCKDCRCKDCRCKDCRFKRWFGPKNE